MAVQNPTANASGGWSVKRRFLLLSLFVLVADQGSKWWVEAELPLHRPHEVIAGFLNFTHVRNTGVAFGLFAAQGDLVETIILTLLGLLALALVAYYFAKTANEARWLLTALALILGGAVGNLVDRVANGGVTDFIDVFIGNYHWHTFNVADSAISVGIGFLILDTLVGRHHSNTEQGSLTDSGAAPKSAPSGQ